MHRHYNAVILHSQLQPADRYLLLSPEKVSAPVFVYMQGVGAAEMQGRHADDAPPVIGVANTYTAPGVYSLQVPCPRTRYAPAASLLDGLCMWRTRCTLTSGRIRSYWVTCTSHGMDAPLLYAGILGLPLVQNGAASAAALTWCECQSRLVLIYSQLRHEGPNCMC